MSGATVAGRRRPGDHGPHGSGSGSGDGRPTTLHLLLGQTAFAVTALWRMRIVLVFTFAIPLVWLLVIGALVGNDMVDDETGVRVMQFATPNAAAMGVIYAAYPTVAIALAEARARGILRRVRGTPMPAWTFLAGQVAGAAVFALASVVTMFAVGVALYDVQLFARTFPALVVTLAAGIATFAALGTAVAAVARSASLAQSASIASAVILTFISGLFSFGGRMPAWISTVADLLPLRPFVEALQDQLNPFHDGSGWDWRALAILALWGTGSSLVAARAFRWDPPTRAPAPPVDTTTRSGTTPLGAATATRPSWAALVVQQTRAANLSTWRDPGSVFFAVVMPVGLYAFFLATQGPGLVLANGIPFETHHAASMITWGAGVTAFMYLPEAVALARDRGVLKRLRGTPLRPWQYLAGRTTAALGVTFLVAVAVLATGALFFDLVLTASGLALGGAVLVLATLTMTACGYVLVALSPSSRTVGAVGLVILLPLAFFSDVFVADGPTWMSTVGSLFPLKHAQNALTQALDPAGASVGWVHVAVLVVWLVGAGLVALRYFRWDSREHT